MSSGISDYADAAGQVPATGKLNVDHVAHFVPHIDSASTALERAGFTLTPFSAQSHRSEPGGPLVDAGTGNRCVMLKRGYLEFLTPTGDTPVANQLRNSIQRYVGVHLVAFGSSAAERDHARLARAGFSPLAPLALQRRIGTENGEDTARFTVVRVLPGTMAEGRIQFCQHHTPHLVWQPRWLAHDNHASALNGVLLCVENPQQAAQRYARFTGLLPYFAGNIWSLATARGYLLFVSPETLQQQLGINAPALPWIAGYIIECADMTAASNSLRRAGCEFSALGNRRILAKLPSSLGGLMIFEPPKSGAFNFD
jgi:hypothetical protein